MEKEKIIKIGNGEKVAKGGGGSLGHRMYGDLKGFVGKNPGIANSLLAGGAANLVSRATGSRRAGRNMMGSLGNTSMFGGKTLNESLGKGSMGTSINDGLGSRLGDMVMSPFSQKARLRRSERSTGYGDAMNTTLGNRLTTLTDADKIENKYNEVGKGKDFISAKNNINYGTGGVKTNSYKEASAIPAAVSTFMKTPMAKNLGKAVGSGLAFGTAEGASKRVVGGEKPEATKSTVETKPLGH